MGNNNRETVIEALECCIIRHPDDKMRCVSCPYKDPESYCLNRLKMDALALLKAQEPNEDWISRERLKNEIQYYIDEAGWGEEANKVLGWCLEFIDNQKAVKWE